MRHSPDISREKPKSSSRLQATPWWRGLYFVVIAYLILGFTWWAVLLYIKNLDAFQAKTELLRFGMLAEGLYENEDQFLQTPAFLLLKNKYHNQEWMIYGESAVFVVTLIIGVILINRGYQKEMRVAQHQRNFLLSITHELKSPLASIRLVLETLLKRELPPDKIQYISQRALRETDRLHRLVNNLLLSTRLDTVYTPVLELVNLPKLIRETLSVFSENYPDVTLNLYAEEELLLWQGDKEGLTSVTINLLENAVKYAEGDPKIEIRIREEGEKIIWTVADQGIGIDDKEKSYIFDKFYRVGNEDTRKTKGTGLGLYIVRQIVRAHSGRITVGDNQPRGTVFVIEIPNKNPEGWTR